MAEIVTRDNVPALVPQPTETAERLSKRVVVLSGADLTTVDLRKSFEADKRRGDSIRLSLPPSVFLGQPGKSGHRVAPTSLTLPADADIHGKPFKPDWSPLLYHPKLAARRRPKLMAGRNGRKVVALENQSFIYGSDDRAVFYPSGYPWHCIGKVDVFPSATAENPTSWGSGVLIGDRLVLTAGHVPPVNPPSGQWKMRFTAGLYNGSPVDGAGAISYISDFNGYLGGVSGIDYAVLRLYEPLGSDLGYFGWKTYDTGWNGGDYWWLAGYPFDIANDQSPSYQSGIVVLDADANQGGLEIEHQGDTASGDSGGPFWGFWADGFPYVVGTTSGHEIITGRGAEDNNIAAGGDALSHLLAWARSTWPL
jgi:V8-like Glu-specific endopeptidase